MTKKIILGIVVATLAAAALFCVVVALQPNDYRVTRSATMAAPAEEVFSHVNDFHKWNAWSPWAKLDPDAKNSFEGSEAGEGAVFRWSGNDEVGEGSLTILESKPNEHIGMKLEFIRPFPDSCLTEFDFQPAGNETKVTWTMLGRHPGFVSKAFCFVMNMDKMIGRDFDKGLANIKAIVEAPESAKPEPPQPSGDAAQRPS
jgi:hypothetical protein